MIQQLAFAFSITGPILLVLLVGVVLRQMGIINDAFVKSGNALVFYVTLPLLLFVAIATQDQGLALPFRLVLFGIVFTILSVIVLLLFARWLYPADKVGVWVQGAFRGNMGIIGIALVLSTYGETALPQAAFYVGMVTVVYNIASIWVLQPSGRLAVARMVRNPLILGVVSGYLFHLSGWSLPTVLLDTSSYLTNLTLPLALLCIGSTLSWRSMLSNRASVIAASVTKLLVLPACALTLAVLLGFRGSELGILFFMWSAPTAAASYIMAKHYTRHDRIAAEIVAVTTVLSPISIMFGLAALKGGGLL